MKAAVFIDGKSLFAEGGSREEALEGVQSKTSQRLSYRPADDVIFQDNPHVPCGLFFEEVEEMSLLE